MIKIGEYNTLRILRHTPPGLFLGNDEGEEILLPNKYIPEEYELEQELDVFCYLDHEERPVATTIDPLVKKDEYALLKVSEVNRIGAFMDWGLEKQLLVPFKEQARPMVEGKWYLVHCYMDHETDRLVASSKTNRFLSNEDLTVEEDEKVKLLVSRFTDLGTEVIINQKHKGLIFNSELFRTLKLGEKLTGYIKNIREDNKIDVTLRKSGYDHIEPTAQLILEKLQEEGGFLPLHDKSAPEEIKDLLQMSKKTFKKAIGSLYKQKIIILEDKGIRMNA